MGQELFQVINSRLKAINFKKAALKKQPFFIFQNDHGRDCSFDVPRAKNERVNA